MGASGNITAIEVCLLFAHGGFRHSTRGWKQGDSSEPAAGCSSASFFPQRSSAGQRFMQHLRVFDQRPQPPWLLLIQTQIGVTLKTLTTFKRNISGPSAAVN